MNKLRYLIVAFLLFFTLVACDNTTPPTIDGVKITLSSNTSLSNASQTVSAEVTGTGAFSKAVIWTSSAGTFQSTTGNDNTFTAPTVTSTTSVTITATSSADSSKADTVTLTVNPIVVPPTITNVTASAVMTTLNAAANTELSATVTGTGIFDAAVNWSIVSGGGTLSATTGSPITFNAPSLADSSTTIVRATSVQDPSKTAEITLNINAFVTPSSITGISISASQVSLSGAETSTLVASVTGTGAFSNAVTWSIDSGGGSLSATSGTNVTFTAPNVIGTTIIRATSVQDTSKSATVSIVVTKTITALSINPSNLDVKGNTSQVLTVNVTGTGAFSNAVTWAIESGGGSLSASSGTSVTFTAPNIVGTTIIRVTSVQDTSKSSTVGVVVTGTITAVGINPSNPKVSGNANQVLTVNVTGTGILSNAVTWVIESGGGSLSATSGTNVTFTAPDVIGTTIIRATSVQDSSKSATVNIEVTGTIAAVSINPGNPEVNAGTGQLLTANVTGTGTFSSAVTWEIQSGAGSLSSNSGTAVTFTAPNTGGTTIIRATSVQDPSKSMTSTIEVLIAVNGTVLQWNGKALNGTTITVVDAKGKLRNTTSAPDGAFSIFLSPPYQITAVPSLGTNLVPMSYDNTTITNPVLVLRKNTFTLDTSPGFESDCTPIASDGILRVELSQPVGTGNTGEVVYIAPGIDYRPTFSYAHLTQPVGSTIYNVAVKFDKDMCYNTLIGTVVYLERNAAGTIVAQAALASVPMFPNTITKLNSDADAFAPKLNVVTSSPGTFDGTTTLPFGVSSASVTSYLRVEYNIPLGKISKIAPNINLGLRTAYYPLSTTTINNSGASTFWQIPAVDFPVISGLKYRLGALGTVFERGTVAWSDVLSTGALQVALNPPSFGTVIQPSGVLILPVNSPFRAPNGNIIPEIIGRVVQNTGCSGGNNFLNNYIFGLLGTSALWLGSSNDEKVTLPDTNEPARIIMNVDYSDVALNALCIREADTTNVSDKILDGRSIQRNFYTDAALTNPDFIGAGTYNLTKNSIRFIN